MIHTQDHGNYDPPSFYAYCPFGVCGVCSPLRRRWSDALADDLLHTSVCSTRKTT